MVPMTTGAGGLVGLKRIWDQHGNKSGPLVALAATAAAACGASESRRSWSDGLIMGIEFENSNNNNKPVGFILTVKPGSCQPSN